MFLLPTFILILVAIGALGVGWIWGALTLVFLPVILLAVMALVMFIVALLGSKSNATGK